MKSQTTEKKRFETVSTAEGMDTTLFVFAGSVILITAVIIVPIGVIRGAFRRMKSNRDAKRKIFKK